MSVLSNKYSLVFVVLLFVSGVIGVIFYYANNTTILKNGTADSSLQTEMMNGRMIELERKMDVLTDTLTGLLESTVLEAGGNSLPSDRLTGLESDIQSLFGLLEDLTTSSLDQSSDNQKGKGIQTYEEQQLYAEKQKEFIDASFQNQSVDQIWASGVETEFGELLNKPKLQVAQIKDIDCRSTMCRAELAVEKLDRAEAGDFENHLLIDLMSVFKGGVNLQREVSPNGEVSMTAYLVKEGHQIPQPPRSSSSDGAN